MDGGTVGRNVNRLPSRAAAIEDRKYRKRLRVIWLLADITLRAGIGLLGLCWMSTEWEQEVLLSGLSGKGSKGCIRRSRRADKRHAGLTTQRWNTWRRVQGSAAAAAKPRFRGGRALFPTRTPPVARPRVHPVRRHPCLELSSTRPALSRSAGYFRGKHLSQNWRLGALSQKKRLQAMLQLLTQKFRKFPEMNWDKNCGVEFLE